MTRASKLPPSQPLTPPPTSPAVPQLANAPAGYGLYECGGNLQRRRLRSMMLLLPVLKVNPALTLMVMEDRF